MRNSFFKDNTTKDFLGIGSIPTDHKHACGHANNRQLYIFYCLLVNTATLSGFGTGVCVYVCACVCVCLCSCDSKSFFKAPYQTRRILEHCRDTGKLFSHSNASFTPRLHRPPHHIFLIKWINYFLFSVFCLSEKFRLTARLIILPDPVFPW